MADEWVPMFAQGSVLGIPFICANGTGIEMGTALKLADPFTVSAHSGELDSVGGVALAEKIASDGVTTIPVARSGIWKVTGSGNITAGDPVGLADAGFPNQVFSLKSVINLSGNVVVGTALETSTTGQTLLIELKPYSLPWSQT